MSRPTVWLLDSNLLIAMTHEHHVHHPEAIAWFDAVPRRRWATCAITQLAFVRLGSHPRIAADATTTPADLMAVLARLASHPQHDYWPESPSPLELSPFDHPAFVGHRQVTDLYLLSLAAQRKQVLATLDRGLVSFAQAANLQAHVELVTRPTAQEGAARYAARRPRQVSRPR